MKLYLVRSAKTFEELLQSINGTIAMNVDRAKISIWQRANHARMMIDKRVEACGVVTDGLYAAKIRLNSLYGKFVP